MKKDLKIEAKKPATFAQHSATSQQAQQAQRVQQAQHCATEVQWQI